MKHKLLYAITTFALLGGLISCKKNDNKLILSSSLTIVNTISGAGGLVPNFNAPSKLQYYKPIIAVAASYIPAYTSTTPFLEYQAHIGTFPLGISLATDTLHYIYTGNVTMEPGSIHSLYFTGPLTGIDTIFTTDHVPHFAPADSLVGVRFINTSKGSTPISINIKNQTTPVIGSLPYKSASGFTGYPAKTTVPATTSYIFEIREAATTKLITTYTLSSLTTRLGKSYTIALKGIPGSQGSVLINNF